MNNLGFSDEPALWVAVVDALLVLGVSFGLPITPEQKTAIDVVIQAVAGIVIRSQVTPTSKVPLPLPPPAPLIIATPPVVPPATGGTS